MKKYYVSENLNMVLTDEEYEKLLNSSLKRDSKQYELLEIDINIGDESTFIYLDKYMQENTGDTALDNLPIDIILENRLAIYKLTDHWDIDIEFDIIELCEKDPLNSIIKITSIYII